MDPKAIVGWLPEGVLATAILMAAVYAVRQLVAKMIQAREGMEESDRRRWLTTTRNVALAFLAVGLIFIWLPQLSTFALSITAFVVAVVIATKELILCLSGLVMRIATRPFEVGDWIEIDGLKGEVIDEGMLGFTLQEIDGTGRSNEFTGRTLVVPNSRLVSTHVVNERFRRRYIHHHFRFIFDRAVDPEEPMALAKAALAERCQPFAEVAQRYWSRIRGRSGVAIPGPEPKVALRTTDLGRPVLEMTVFCPVGEAEGIEQAAVMALAKWAAAQTGTREAGAPAAAPVESA